MSDDGEFPLHVRVALALGVRPRMVRVRGSADRYVQVWSDSRYYSDGSCDEWELRRSPGPLAYDTDWAATGPLIKRLNIALRPPTEPERSGEYWEAYAWIYPSDWDGRTYGDVREVTKGDKEPLIAVCNLILALKEAGKL